MPLARSSPDHPLPRHVQRLCRLIHLSCALAMVATVVVPVAFWLTPDWVLSQAPTLSGLDAQTRLTLDGRALALGALATLPAVACSLWLLMRLWQLFGEYLVGRIFSPLALQALRGTARALLLGAVLAPLQRTALALAFTLGNPPGQRMLVLGLGSSDLVPLLTGAVLLAITSVMAVAARQADENASFV